MHEEQLNSAQCMPSPTGVTSMSQTSCPCFVVHKQILENSSLHSGKEGGEGKEGDEGKEGGEGGDPELIACGDPDWPCCDAAQRALRNTDDDCNQTPNGVCCAGICKSSCGCATQPFLSVRAFGHT